MIPLGELDRVTVIVGERGMGKSTLAWLDAREFRRETGGYVVGHSPNGQIGARPDIRFHERVVGWRGLARGLRRQPGDLHFVTRGPAEDILTFAEGLSRAVRRSAHHREFKLFHEHLPPPPGLQAPPVLAVIDEGTSMRRHPTAEEEGDLERLLVNARHKHLAITWSIQAPTRRQWILLEQANRLRVFRYTHEYGANALRAAGVPKEVVYDFKDLPRFSYFHLDKGSDSPGEYRVLPRP